MEVLIDICFDLGNNFFSTLMCLFIH